MNNNKYFKKSCIQNEILVYFEENNRIVYYRTNKNKLSIGLTSISGDYNGLWGRQDWETDIKNGTLKPFTPENLDNKKKKEYVRGM